MARLCTDGVVREDTPVRSTQFRRRVNAAAVPALLPQISPIAADPKAVKAALRFIPSKNARARWYQFYPLEPLASAVAVVILLAGAAFAVYTRYADAPAGAARLGRAGGAVAWTFLLPLLAGWLCAAVAWRVTRERRWAALGAFWLAAAPVFCAAFYAPQFGQRPGADARREADKIGAPAQQTSAADPHAGSRDTAPASLNDTDELRLKRVVRWWVVASVDAYARYDRSIRALNLDEVWEPRRLADAATYAETRDRCDAVRRALKELGEQLEQVQTGVAERARSSGAAPRAREIFMAEYAVHRNDERAAFRAFAAGEKRLLYEIESLLDFLEDRAGTGAMTARGGQILFRDRGDLDEFKARAQRLSALATQRVREAADGHRRVPNNLNEKAAADAR
jgi:hypothetical protein